MANRSKTLNRRNHRKRSKEKRKPCLEIKNGCFAGLKIPVSIGKTTIGSDINCTICLDHTLVSDEHAMITKSGSSCRIEDLNSKQGIFVNGREVHNTELKDRDRISIGNFDLVFYD